METLEVVDREALVAAVADRQRRHDRDVVADHPFEDVFGDPLAAHQHVRELVDACVQRLLQFGEAVDVTRHLESPRVRGVHDLF